MTVRAPLRQSGALRVGELLHDCLRSGGLGPLESSPWAAPRRLGELVEALQYHRLDALFADLAATAGLPVHLDHAFRAVRLHHSAQRASLAADSRWLAERLDGAPVPWMLLKGVVTAERHHQRPEQRSFSDLDVLVAPEDFGTAVDDLVAGGARLLESNWALVRRLGCGELNLVLPFGTVLDLHWSIIAAPHDRRAFSVVPEDLLARRVSVALRGGAVVPAPDPVDEFVHLCLHAALGGTNSLGRWRDVVLAARTGLDWDEVVSRSRAWRVGLPVAAALDRARHLYPEVDEVVPAGVLPALAPSRGWLPLMRYLGERAPATSAPPATRWSSHLKLTRASAVASYGYAVTELVGYALHPWYQRPRDDWDQTQMQRPDGDERARRGYFHDVASQARR